MAGHQLLLQARAPHESNVLFSLYAAHLQAMSVMGNTARKELESAAFLLSWAAANAPDLCLRLARGQPPTLTQCRAFAAWLKARSGIGRTAIAPAAAGTFNATLRGARRFSQWAFSEGNAGNAHAMTRALDAHRRIWRQVKPLYVAKEDFAEDLEDAEIREIETVLARAAASGGPDSRVAARDYLMWRMAIEYGLRIGEILALRLEDLPSRTQDWLKIVRIEGRGNLFDPREPRAPKVKTLGRDLGCYFRNSRFPQLFSLYQSSHRWVWASRKSGARYQKTRFAHPYLVINATDGMPLSMQSAQRRAAFIRAETVVDFHWHAARHAFFNRAYVLMDGIKDPLERKDRRAGLVYWGGWSSPDSLDIYTATARRNKARGAALALEGTDGKAIWSAID
ncbi:site-specific integrase [Mangrovicoccus sp. HB161399]|uniref:site-specific integrase n=1 Tax=Mangrovicoccus sp. HB161399 TaxID=2720392 RepID=UPI0015571039|nr:site-specific integrase [Mangrovicoccus sp. HB161399]